jgi:hypothetical protein
MWENRVNLQFQFEWAGAQLRNTYKLVCKHCLDIPQEQLRAIVLPADPVPIYYPSPEDFANAEEDFRAVSSPPVIDLRTGLTYPQNDLRVNQGLPTEYGVPLSLLSVIGNGTATVTVTCSKVHNLQPNAQVSVEGLSVPSACGVYTVTPTTATQLTYQTFGATPQASLLTPTSRIITVTIGLPLGFDSIPKINGPALDPGTLVGFSNESGSGQFVLEDGVTYLGQENGQ